jgi:hypothetical protein
MLFNIMFCSCLNNIKWLQNCLMPCPLKKLTGIDCPFCGFQRSVIALIQGDLNKSLHLYPATIPVLLIAVLGVAGARFNNISRVGYIKKGLYVFTGLIIAGAYFLKMTYSF